MEMLRETAEPKLKAIAWKEIIMFIPQLRVQELKPFFNTRLICIYLSPEKAKNKTLPFAEKTYQMYPELSGTLDGLDDEHRYTIIKVAVEKRLYDAKDEINKRITYFDNKFKTFIPDFIEAQCRLYNYEWKEMHALEEMESPKFPDVLWFLEEMMVETTLNDSMVKPYTLYENRAYKLFYNLTINGKSVIDNLRDMYCKKCSIESFILHAYDFTQNHISDLYK